MKRFFEKRLCGSTSNTRTNFRASPSTGDTEETEQTFGPRAQHNIQSEELSEWLDQLEKNRDYIQPPEEKGEDLPDAGSSSINAAGNISTDAEKKSLMKNGSIRWPNEPKNCQKSFVVRRQKSLVARRQKSVVTNHRQSSLGRPANRRFLSLSRWPASTENGTERNFDYKKTFSDEK